MIATPYSRAGEIALGIYEEALRSVHGGALVRAHVAREGDRLRVGEHSFDLRDFRRVFVCGAGKASAGMAETLVSLLSDRLNGGLVVTKDGHGLPLGPVEVMEAGHPVPDVRSLEAGERMLRLAEETREGDLVIFALSGGASALMEAPVEGVTLEDLREVNQALLAQGATIISFNTIRPCLSRLKSGGLGRAFRRAQVVCLVLSDVSSNDVRAIGSGPLVGGKLGDAAKIARAFRLQERVGERVWRLIETASPPEESPEVPHILIGDCGLALDAARRGAEARGRKPHVVHAGDLGEARERGRVLAGMFHSDATVYPHVHRGVDTYIWGGESTVTLRGPGLGGRCQEMACGAAEAIMANDNLAFLAAGTDGTDGPTDAAGALVDGRTVARAEARGWTVERALETNDSYRFHEAAGTLIKTGPTQSNVNDLIIVVRS